MKCLKHQFHFPYYERPAVVVNTAESFEAVTQQYGTLITPFVASAMAGVTNQRIYALIEAGKFTKIVVYGVMQIPKKEFDQWNRSAREAGRPRRAKNGCQPPTISEATDADNAPHLFAELPAQRKGCE